MHTDSGMTGISPSGFMPYMTVASLEMSDEPFITLLTGIGLKLPVFIDHRKTKHLRSFQNSANNWFADVFSFLLHKGKTEKSSQMPFPVISGRTFAKIEKLRTHRAIDYQ